jgi:protease II
MIFKLFSYIDIKSHHIGIESKETSEVYAVDLMDVKGGVAHKVAMESKICLHPREEGMRYSADHHEDSLYVITNKDNSKNNKLMKISLKEVFEGADNTVTKSSNSRFWKDVKAYDPKVQIDTVLPFKDFFAVFGREDGLPRVWLMTPNEEVGMHMYIYL